MTKEELIERIQDSKGHFVNEKVRALVEVYKADRIADAIKDLAEATRGN